MIIIQPQRANAKKVSDPGRTGAVIAAGRIGVSDLTEQKRIWKIRMAERSVSVKAEKVRILPNKKQTVIQINNAA